MIRLAILLGCFMAVSGCGTAIRDIGQPPPISPVGEGLRSGVDPVVAVAFPAPPRSSPQSLWDDERANLFRDVRAGRVGDVLTVTIDLDEKATLGNNSDLKNEATVGNGFDASLGIGSSPSKIAPQLDITSNTETKGTSSIDRSDKIRVSVAAVVTAVLPNGNLVISGSQEIRVNEELRVLEIAGVVRPRDLSKENTVPYTKIAEARISYGGEGRMINAQKPGWGYQLYNALKPF